MSFDIDITLLVGGQQIDCRIVSDAPVVALYGPSGVGKTSVLHAIAGLRKPENGHITVGGRVLFDQTDGIDIAPEHRACGMVFQDLRLFPHRSVRDNLLFGWRLADPARQWLSFEEVCRFLGIDALLDRNPSTLSGGEAKRVAIGRAILAAPRFLLLDEPLSSLDVARREGIMAVIESVRDRLGLPMLLVSHELAEVDRLAGHVVKIG